MSEIMKYNAAIYVRLSKEDEDTSDGRKTESNSITNQKQLILDFLQDKPEINIVSVRIDDGYTGTNYDRPAFQLMMNDIKAGTVNCVVVKDLSRFGREYINAGKYIDRLFPFYGVRLIAINDNIDTVMRDSTDDFSITLKNLMNDNYCRDISLKIRSQFQVRRKNGEYLGAFAPYGYMKSEDDHTKLEIDPYAAGVVQDIFRWKIEGMSQAAIAARLTEQKILAPLEYKRSTGSGLKCSFQKHAKVEWTAVGIGRILSNRVYTGTMIQGVRTRPNYKIRTVVVNPPEKWVVVEHAFDAIVSEKTFDLVQRLLKMDTRVSPGKKVVFPLAGLLFCADCGSPMVRRTIAAAAKNKQICYACSGYKDRGACTSHTMPERQLLDTVLALLQQHIRLVVQMDECLKAIKDAPLQQIRARKAQERIEKAETEEFRYRKLKASLYEDFKEDLISKEDFLEIRAQYDSRITDALIAKEQVQRELNMELDKSGRRSQWVQDLLAHQNIPSLTRAVAVECIERILVYEDKTLEIEFTHAQDYTEMLAHVQEYSDDTADGEKAVV